MQEKGHSRWEETEKVIAAKCNTEDLIGSWVKAKLYQLWGLEYGLYIRYLLKLLIYWGWTFKNELEDKDQFQETAYLFKGGGKWNER